MAVANLKQPSTDHEQNARSVLDRLDELIGRMLPAFPRRALGPAPPISPHDGRALLWLGRHVPCLVSDLAKGLDIPLSTATHLVNRLVDKKLVIRLRSDEDRRIVQLQLSENGHRLDKRFCDSRLAASLDLLQQLSPKEQASLLSLLSKMLKR